jgi:translation initiation factor 1
MARTNQGAPRPRIYIENRRGKHVTIISGLHTYGEQRLAAIAKELKIMCGAGGTVKDGKIEVQGDNRSRVEGWFRDNKG